MKTEEIQRRPRGRDPNEVSRALQELTPRAWSVVDRRGRDVPLTSAGYVLRFGQAYHLRIVSPFKPEEIEQVFVENPPPFITVQPGRFDKEEQGCAVYDLSFKVNLDPWANLRRLGMSVLGDDLEVVHTLRPGVYRDAPVFLCPIVLRPRWAAVVAGVLGGLLLILLERLLTGLFTPNRDVRDGIADVLEALGHGHSWGFFLVLALGVWLIVTAVNAVLLYRRSRVLRQDFRETYPPV